MIAISSMFLVWYDAKSYEWIMISKWCEIIAVLKKEKCHLLSHWILVFGWQSFFQGAGGVCSVANCLFPSGFSVGGTEQAGTADGTTLGRRPFRCSDRRLKTGEAINTLKELAEKNGALQDEIFQFQHILWCSCCSWSPKIYKLKNIEKQRDDPSISFLFPICHALCHNCVYRMVGQWA